MKTTLFVCLCAGCALLAGPASATITMTDGDALFEMRDGTFTNGNWAGDFFVDGTGTDHLFRNQWYYRSQDDTRELELSSNNNFAEGAAGNTGFIEWRVDQFHYRLDMVLTDTGVGTAIMEQSLSITNEASVERAISIYNYSDIEFGGFLSPNNATREPDGFTVTNPGIADMAARHLDYGVADHWQLADANDIFAMLDDIDADVLNDTNTIAFGDMSGAFQFDLFLLAGQTHVVETAIAIVPPPSAAGLIGFGGLLAGRRRR